MTTALGSTIAGRFRLEERAGSGGMGTVYRAIDRATGERVALKLVHEDASAERFLREGRLLASLAHPAIVRHVAHGTTESGEPWLAMEWLEGEDLGEALARGALSPNDAVAVASTVASGLAAMHAIGIVHRDIKPANIFLEGRDLRRAKILDLGVARPPPSGTRLTRTGAVAGTAGYLAPEQARGVDPDPRADVFALGCVLFEAITGRRAFAGEHLLAVLARILLEETPRASDLAPGLPRELDDLIMRMLAKDPDARPKDGAAALAELRGLAGLALALGPLSREIPSSLRTITEMEQRVVSVVVAQAAIAKTATATDEADVGGGLEEIAKMRGARLETLADGSILVAFTGGAPTDRAAHAAYAALMLRDLFEGAHISVATGRAMVRSSEAGGPLIGDAIDRAAASANVGPRVVVDDTTAALLDDRFEVKEGAPKELVGVRVGASSGVRKLLGKPTPCVGRDRELALLNGMFDEVANEGVARCALVVGPPGIGKSRLRDEFLRRVASSSSPATVLFARAEAIGKNSAFGMAGQALRRAAGVLEDEPILLRQAKLAAFVAEHVGAEHRARVTELLAEIAGAPFVEHASTALRAARADPQLMSDGIRAAFADLVSGASKKRPVLVVLEDVHWGDFPTVHLVDHVLAKLADSPILVLALARPEVATVFPRLWSSRAITEVRLAEISKKAAERLVREALGAVSDDIVRRIVERAAGNAFYLEELIRATAEAGADASSMSLPGTVLAMVQARLDALDAEARRVLRAASVFGDVFWKSALVGSLGGDAATPALARLSDLEAREIVERRSSSRFGGEEELVFRHALFREAAYELLTEDDKRVSHRHAAKWLEKAGETDACVLAEHFERGDEPIRAARAYLRASEQALEGDDLVASLARARKAAALGLEGEELGRARSLEASALRWQGDNSAALEAASAAAELLPRGEAQWCAAIATLVTLLGRLGRYDDIFPLFTSARDAGATIKAPHAAVGIYSRVVNALIHAGRTPLADEVLAELERASASISEADPMARGLVHFAIGTRALMDPDPPRALEHSEIAARAFREAGDRRMSCTANITVGCACMELGAYDRAAAAFEASANDAVALGAAVTEAAARSNLGAALAKLGRSEQAIVELDRAIATGERSGDVRLTASTRFYKGQLLLERGDVEGARSSAQTAADEATTAKPLRALALALVSEVHLRSGARAEALSASRAAMELLGELGSLEEGETRLRVAHAEALRANGALDEALAAIARAKDLLLDRAARLPDAWKARYLAVSENARALELFEQWSRAS